MDGRPEADGIELATIDDVDPPRPGRRGSRPWMRVAVAIAAVALVVAAVAVVASDDDGSRAARDAKRPTKVVTDPVAQRTVAAALGASTGTGGYEVAYDFVIEPPSELDTSCEVRPGVSHGNGPGSDGDGSVATTVGGQSVVCTGYGGGRVTVSGHGIVHLNPYLLETTSTVSGLGEVAVRTDGTQIVEQGGGNYGSLNDGQPLSGFASLVEGTFGQGPGALSMLGLASPTGYLSLSADAVTGVTAVGTGLVAGVPVTYYDVVSDTKAMQRLHGLTAEQQKTIDEALVVLDRSGFVEAHARVAVDGDGYIRESTSTANFADGTKMTRHMTLSRFGCIGAGPTPINPTGTPEHLPPECSTPPTAPPAVAESTTTTTLPVPSTTVVTDSSSTSSSTTTSSTTTGPTSG